MAPKTRQIVLAAAVGGVVGIGAAVFAPAALAGEEKAHTVLVDASGQEMGEVWFKPKNDKTEVRVELAGLPAGAKVDAFHGFHVHANDDPANGEGCIADPDKDAKNWFVSADGHFKEGDEAHHDHRGDMPPVLADADGRATARFLTDRFTPADLEGRVVIIHAGPDNLGNIPVGDGPTQYTANSDEASAATAKTGNAGDRLGCGVIEAG